MENTEWRRDEYLISTDKEKIDINIVHGYLVGSYWAEGIPRETVVKSIRHSLCFGIYKQEKQIGFARVISDFASFAYLADVFVMEEERGKGLSKWLMKIIISHPQLQGLRRFILATRDAHRLYARFGFAPFSAPDRWMERYNPEVYKSNSKEMDRAPGN